MKKELQLHLVEFLIHMDYKVHNVYDDQLINNNKKLHLHQCLKTLKEDEKFFFFQKLIF
jgi:hypothetical protein